MTAAIVIPSFARPRFLRRCLSALATQLHAADEVVVATRAGDTDTAAVVAEAGVRLVFVGQSGHLPPLVAGVRAASADIVCFVDDDAEPWPSWLAALLRHYGDPSVGGVGGLVSQPGPDDRTVRPGPMARITRSGRFDSLGTEAIPTSWGARDVDVIRGTNMSFRRELLLRYPWDGRLNRGAATDYEVDLCLWVRKRGFRLVYDPDAVVTHRLAPRPDIGRAPTPERISDYSHNLVYVAGKALPRWQAATAVAGAFLLGTRASYGIGTAVADSLLGRPPSVRREVVPAFQGKIQGLRSLRAHRRAGPLPLEGTTEGL